MDVALPSGGSVGVVVRGAGDLTLLLAHGAGTDQYHRSIVGVSGAIAEHGVRVVTFNYPYTEAGRRRPDRLAVLLESHAAVATAIEDQFGGPLVLGGRSMGGRMATMLVADGYPARGLVLFAYPLHPAGKPDNLRIDHLAAVKAPMLFFHGSRDALSRGELFDLHVRSLPTATVVDMEGADHSFRGRDWPEDKLYDFLARCTVDWIGRIDG